MTATITERCALTCGVTRLQRALEADAAVEVVRDRGDEQHDDEPGEEPVDHELDERQVEDVEADVLVELRVLDAELDAVREQDPLPPLRRDTDPGDQGEEQRDADADPTPEASGGLLVPGDELVLGRRRGHRRGSAVRAGRR